MNLNFITYNLLNKSVLILFMTFCSVFLYSQNINQLESQLQKSDDSDKAKIQLELSQAYLQINQSKSISYALEALEFGNNKNSALIRSNANFLLGQAYFLNKDYSKAYRHAKDAVDYFKTNDQDNFYAAKELLGDISFEQNKFEQTVIHLKEAFSYYDKRNDFKNAGFVASKMGSSYEKLNDFNKATKWHKKAFENFRKSKNYREMIVSQSILGGVYSNYGDYNSAKIALNTAYDLAITHGLIDEFDKLEERLEIVTKNAESNDYATTEFEREKTKNQEEKISKAVSQRAKTLKEIEKLSEEKQLVELKIRVQQDEYEKNILAERLEKLEIEEALKQETLEKENLKLALDNEKLLSDKKTAENQRLFILLSALGVIILLTILALLIKNRSNRKLAQKNREIQRQKSEIEEKQENINQSIVYATRIQEAILPSPDKLLSNFSDAFVYLNPKDQVSGDFVWTHKMGSEFFVCVADCTGHGVPGAFMSIIFNNILDEIVKKEKIDDPGKILERSSTLLYEKVKEQSQDLSSFKDGMDAIILKIDTINKKAAFCGAKNGLFLIRDGKLNEFKGVRRSIDISATRQDAKAVFSSEEIDIQPNDTFYLTTDGFVDQKGGEDNTKFYKEPFRKLLLKISDKNMAEQKSAIHDTFIEWSYNTVQIDDVLIVGLRI
ncbi:MAG: SpoIIE family protein phosphatase [Brumimicrobium sp.]